MTAQREIECPQCNGYGWTDKRMPMIGVGLYEVTCRHCNGHGWREMTEDELNDAASDEWSEVRGQ